MLRSNGKFLESLTKLQGNSHGNRARPEPSPFIGTFTGSWWDASWDQVFNVLFVIGMCALASLGPLGLTWWPLFRDSILHHLATGSRNVFRSVWTIDI